MASSQEATGHSREGSSVLAASWREAGAQKRQIPVGRHRQATRRQREQLANEGRALGEKAGSLESALQSIPFIVSFFLLSPFTAPLPSILNHQFGHMV